MKIRFLILLFCVGVSAGFAQHKWKTSSVALPAPPDSLFGTLTLPDCKEGCPLVFIVAGSGPTDRNGNSTLNLRTNSYKMLAEGLAENGIASFRYDKRGIGQSRRAMHAESDIRFGNSVDDLVAWIDLFKDDARFTKRVIVGHSEGSLVGMMAAQRTKVNGFVSLAGVGKPADQLLREQLIGKLSPEQLEKSNQIMDSLVMGFPVRKIDPALAVLFRPSVHNYLISWFRINPSAEIAKLKIPVFIIQGMRDIQVSPAEAEILAKAKPDAQLLLIGNMDHVLKTMGIKDRSSELQTYLDPKFPLNAKLLPALIAYVNGLN